jgi:hypothetical protein
VGDQPSEVGGDKKSAKTWNLSHAASVALALRVGRVTFMESLLYVVSVGAIAAAVFSALNFL